jgi:kynureninase
MLINGWNDAAWMFQPEQLGNKISRIIGAENDCVVVGETLSVRVYQALSCALHETRKRKIILTDSGNFPSDLYMAQGLIELLNNQFELRICEPDKIHENLNSEIAVLMLTDVDYRTGRKHNIAKINKKAKDQGIITIWDLAHSAGALDLKLRDWDIDYAVGCTYKYLNAGPGSPAFIYVNPKKIDQVKPSLMGWLGHQSPFDFSLNYTPGKGINRMKIGTPPVLANAALAASLHIWDMVNMKDVRLKSIELSERFIGGLKNTCPNLKLASPIDAKKRGSQVSFYFENGYPAMQAIIASGVIGDFRSPNIMRFGITPLYILEKDIDLAVNIISDVLNKKLWDKPKYKKRKFVT